MLDVQGARAEAVFCSCLQPSDDPIPEQVRGAVENVIRTYGSRVCAVRVAEEIGGHPYFAEPRMRWARSLVDAAYPRQRGARRHYSLAR
jgi:hypothetical protein